ncbi:hypothetical protein [Geomicrobium sp. JCM 19055]|uniref:hypothetical protein n=1 Tax=Geomicrobium sp. JCM 19055 TaxID=1460649 RepID=UPI000693B1DA|nr:hypothetical protein [Geomicrobium sp. JCM 19055]
MKRLTGTWVWVVIIATVIGILLTINQVFYLRFLGFAPLANEYLYYIIAIFMSISFLILPAGRAIRRFDSTISRLFF